MNSIEVGKVLKGTLLYTLRIIILSVIAAIPTYFIHNLLVKMFSDGGRLLGFGMPVVLSAIVFAIIGVLELIITRDELVKVILKKVKR